MTPEPNNTTHENDESKLPKKAPRLMGELTREELDAAIASVLAIETVRGPDGKPVKYMMDWPMD